jgi:Ni,Fe-hydrogenase III large subunit
VIVERVPATALRAAVSSALDAGGHFAGAWANADAWHVALIAADARPHVLVCPAGDGPLPTIADLAGGADWDEREAHDTHGLVFDGHDPMRALVAHPSDAGAWETRVEGDGVHQVAVGPIHAGVIESGHFRFHVVGERILAMDPRLFYKHRGLERAAEGGTPEEAIALAQRACAACAATNTVAFTQAVEDARGLAPDRDLRIARTLLLELERLYNHLHDIGALCAGVGFAAGTMAFAALKDRAQAVNAHLFGHRFLFGTVAVGGGAFALDAAAVDAARGGLRELRADAAAAWRELGFAGSFQARLHGVGVLNRDAALWFGACGPAARAAGLHADVRSESPRLWYDAGFVPAVPADATGDVAARLAVRAAELTTTCDLLDDLLARPVAPGTTTAGDDARPLGLARVESPRGATLAAVELRDGRVARWHLRTGSYANWPALAHAVRDNLLPDFPLINKSFELCYACVDR